MDMTYIVHVEGSGRGIAEMLRLLGSQKDYAAVKWVPNRPSYSDPATKAERIIKGAIALVVSYPSA